MADKHLLGFRAVVEGEAFVPKERKIDELKHLQLSTFPKRNGIFALLC